MTDKGILSAALWFAVCAVVTTMVGNFVSPRAGNIAASYYTLYTLKSDEKAADAESAERKSSEKKGAVAVSERLSDAPAQKSPEIAGSQSERVLKESPAAVKAPDNETAVQEQPAEKKPEVAASQAASPVSGKADAPPQPELSEKAAENPAGEAEATRKQAESSVAASKTLTEAEFSEAAKSLAQGEILELGAGRVAYKIKKGDTLSQICRKVFGTSVGWKEKAKKLNIDHRKIRPGDVLIFEKNT